MQIEIVPRQPFIFRSVIYSHGWYQLAPMMWDENANVLHKPERLANGKVITFGVSASNNTSSNTLILQAPDDIDETEIAELYENVAWMFSINSDISAFYDIADREPRLRHCRQHAYGRFLRSSTLFEDVVKVLLTTNIQWGGTKRLAQALVNHFGEQTTVPHPIYNTQTRAFPSSQSIANSNENELRKLGLGYRAPYLLALAQGVASGQIDLERFRHSNLSTLDLRKALLKLPGIGPYAAATLLSILGRYDFIGVDSEAMSTVSKHFYNGEKVGEKEILATFDRWGSFKALAYWFWDYAGTQVSPIEAWEKRQ
jgi:3-methyladenine DNA glycosylase/8-oxoguanine DNA glycosylase